MSLPETTPTLKKVQKLAKSKWIDELSEEEEQMLYKTHRLDKRLAKDKELDILK